VGSAEAVVALPFAAAHLLALFGERAKSIMPRSRRRR
jgi:hypothetical protein